MSTNKIPFLDLVTVHRELREELLSVFETSFDTAGFIGGPVVQGFERDFAEFCDSRFCVGMASGTDALRLSLIGAGVRPGDTVVTVPLRRRSRRPARGRISSTSTSAPIPWIPRGCAPIWRPNADATCGPTAC